MISNRSVPTDTLLPHIPYRDLGTAIAWLSNAFGFVEHYRYGDPLSGVQMRLGDAFIMLKQSHDATATPKQLGVGAQSLTVFLNEIEQHFQHTKSAGVTLIEDLHETVYGELQYAAEDIDGHRWIFSRHARDLDPTQWGATVAHPVAHPVSHATSTSAREVTIAPMLSVRNGPRAVDFYCAAFGAEVLFRIDNEGSVVAELAAGGARFWVADESPEHLNFSPETLGGGTVRMVMVVEDPDALFQRAVDAGARPVHAVADQPYGWRVGRLVDPFGHHWEIGKPLSAR